MAMMTAMAMVSSSTGSRKTKGPARGRTKKLDDIDHHRGNISPSAPDDSFMDGLQSALQYRLRRYASPGTGGTGSSGQEDGMSDPEDASGELSMPVGKVAVKSKRQTAIEEALAVTTLKSSCIVNPRNPLKIIFDVWIGILTFYTIMVLPYRIGFEQEATGSAKIFDYCMDVMFAIDMIVCFRTGYYSDQDVFISNPWKIAKRYVSGLFIADFLSCIPWDLVFELFSGTSGGSGARSIKLLKFVRLVRLLKLTRLMKLQRFLVELEQRWNLNPHMIRMVKLIIKIVFLAHLLACCWHYVALPICGENDVPEPCPEEAPGEVINWVRAFDVDHFDATSRYIASFHFVTATMMAVGYGDIVPTNTAERVVSVCTQLLGATAFGFILSAVTTLLDSANPRDTEHAKRMADLKEWLSGRRIPKPLRKSIREHFNYALSKKSIFNEAEMLGNAPAHIRNMVVTQAYGRWMTMFETCLPREEMSLWAELVVLCKPFVVNSEELVLEPGEISLDFYFVVNGRLEIRIDATAPVVKPEEWAKNCLKPSEAAKKFAQRREDNKRRKISLAVAMDLNPDSELGTTWAEVVCGIYDKAEMFGFLPACPIAVLGQCRAEVISVSKDAIVPLLQRYHGAYRRQARMEMLATQEIQKVLESPEVPEDKDLECPCKSIVLIKGKAEPCEEVLSTLGVWTKGAGPSSPSSAAGPQSPCFRRSRSPRAGKQIRKVGSWQFGSAVTRSFSSKSLSPHGAGATIHTSWLQDGEEVDGDEVEAALLARFIIPPFHRRKLQWDAFVGVLIVYSVLIIPYRIGFGVEAYGGMLVFDWLCDLFFLTDMVLCFRTAFVDDNGLTNTIPSSIRHRYLRTWFLVDFFSTFPVDRIVEAFASGVASTQTRALKLVRIVRLARLLKLARLFKMGKLLKVFEEVIELSPIVMRCMKLGSRLIVMAHLLGCFWYYISMHNNETTPCKSGSLMCSNPDAKVETWWEAVNIGEDQKWEQYVAALYWAFTTMTTVGYGDITPKSDIERIYAIVSMIFGATIFGYIVGSIAALAGNDSGKSMFTTNLGECVKTKKRIAMIRDFCDEQSMAKKTQDAVRLHYMFYYQEKSPYNEEFLLQELPPFLRKQAILHVHSSAIESLGLLQGTELCGLHTGPTPAWFTAMVMRMLEPQVVAAGQDILTCTSESEHPRAQEIFFVMMGECEAYIPRGWSSSGPRSQCDTGGSGDIGGTNDFTNAPTKRERVVRVFSKGCMFGLEHLLPKEEQYQVRSCTRCPSFLYSLRQSVVTEVSKNTPVLTDVIRSAVANALIQQKKSGIPQWNMELRRQKRSSEASKEPQETNEDEDDSQRG